MLHIRCRLAKCNAVALRVVDVGLADGLTEYDWSENVVHSSDIKVKSRKETTKFIDEWEL